MDSDDEPTADVTVREHSWLPLLWCCRSDGIQPPLPHLPPRLPISSPHTPYLTCSLEFTLNWAQLRAMRGVRAEQNQPHVERSERNFISGLRETRGGSRAARGSSKTKLNRVHADAGIFAASAIQHREKKLLGFHPRATSCPARKRKSPSLLSPRGHNLIQARLWPCPNAQEPRVSSSMLSSAPLRSPPPGKYAPHVLWNCTQPHNLLFSRRQEDGLTSAWFTGEEEIRADRRRAFSVKASGAYLRALCVCVRARARVVGETWTGERHALSLSLSTTQPIGGCRAQGVWQLRAPIRCTLLAQEQDLQHPSSRCEGHGGVAQGCASHLRLTRLRGRGSSGRAGTMSPYRSPPDDSGANLLWDWSVRMEFNNRGWVLWFIEGLQ